MAEVALKIKNQSMPVADMPADETLINDPRPDIKQDSALWTRFLAKAYRVNPMLAGALHMFRCMGTQLIPGTQNYRMVPLIGRDYWQSQSDYASDREKYLTPHRKQLINLLRELFQEDQGKGDELPSG